MFSAEEGVCLLTLRLNNSRSPKWEVLLCHYLPLLSPVGLLNVSFHESGSSPRGAGMQADDGHVSLGKLHPAANPWTRFLLFDASCLHLHQRPAAQQPNPGGTSPGLADLIRPNARLPASGL